MGLRVGLGERFEMKGRTVTVTPTAYECLPRVRDFLVELARTGETVTYKELHDELDLPYVPHGMGRFLDVLSQDCILRGEPSLAALVVSSTTGEVGDDFEGDPVAERSRVYAWDNWA